MYRRKILLIILGYFCFSLGANPAFCQPVFNEEQDKHEIELSSQYSGFNGRLGNGDCACLRFKYVGGRVFVQNGWYTCPHHMPGGSWCDEEPPSFDYDGAYIDRTEEILSRDLAPDLGEDWLRETLAYIRAESAS